MSLGRICKMLRAHRHGNEGSVRWESPAEIDSYKAAPPREGTSRPSVCVPLVDDIEKQ